MRSEFFEPKIVAFCCHYCAYSSAMGRPLADIIIDMVETIRRLGPSPLRFAIADRRLKSKIEIRKSKILYLIVAERKKIPELMEIVSPSTQASIRPSLAYLRKEGSGRKNVQRVVRVCSTSMAAFAPLLAVPNVCLTAHAVAHGKTAAKVILNASAPGSLYTSVSKTSTSLTG